MVPAKQSSNVDQEKLRAKISFSTRSLGQSSSFVARISAHNKHLPSIVLRAVNASKRPEERPSLRFSSFVRSRWNLVWSWSRQGLHAANNCNFSRQLLSGNRHLGPCLQTEHHQTPLLLHSTRIILHIHLPSRPSPGSSTLSVSHPGLSFQPSLSTVQEQASSQPVANHHLTLLTLLSHPPSPARLRSASYFIAPRFSRSRRSQLRSSFPEAQRASRRKVCLAR